MKSLLVPSRLRRHVGAVGFLLVCVGIDAACNSETISDTDDPYGCASYTGTWVVSCDGPFSPGETCTLAATNLGFDGCDIWVTGCSFEGSGHVVDPSSHSVGCGAHQFSWSFEGGGYSSANWHCSADLSSDGKSLAGCCSRYVSDVNATSCDLIATKGGSSDASAE